MTPRKTSVGYSWKDQRKNTEIWEPVKEVTIEKVRRNKDRTSGGDSTVIDVIDVGEIEKSFCLSGPDGWVVNRKMKKIILLEFKRGLLTTRKHITGI